MKKTNKNPLESTIEEHLIKKAESNGFLCWKFVTPSANGVPDRILIGNGLIFFIELKRPKGKARELQIDAMQTMALYGATSLVLDTKDKIDKLFEIIGLITVELAFYLLWKINYTLPIIPNEFVPIGSYSVLASVILAFYNGKKGYQSKKIQYAFYCYYPLHIVILGVLSLFFGLLVSWRGIL